MPVDPSDFLRALVLVLTERLQRGQDTALPGVGAWSADTDPATGRVSIVFAEATSDSESVDPSLAEDVSRQVGAPPVEISSRIDGFARAVVAHLRETGSVLLPGIGRLTGKPGGVKFRPELFFSEAVDWSSPPPPRSESTGREVVGEEPEPAIDQSPASLTDAETEASAVPASLEASGPYEPEPFVPAFSDAGDDVPPDTEPYEGVERIPARPGLEPPGHGSGRGQPSAAPLSRPPEPAARGPRRRIPALPLAIAAAVVVTATIVALLMRGGTSGIAHPVATLPDTVRSGLTAAAPVDSSLAVDTTSVAVDGIPENDEADEMPVAVEPVETGPVTSTLPRSLGDFDTSTPGYTLIIGSTVLESDARETIERYRQLELPVSVLAYEEDGSVRFRLAVGLYESAAAADQARQDLSDRLPAGTWVRRIRP